MSGNLVEALADVVDIFSGIEIPQNMDEVIAALSAKKRSDWVERGVSPQIAESVWQHTLQLKLAGLFYCRNYPSLDREVMMQMAYVYDMAEAIVRDYRPGEIEPEEKFRRELKAMEYIVTLDKEDGPLMMKLWRDYSECRTPEGAILKQLDKIDPVAQAINYCKRGYKTEGFLRGRRKRVTDPFLKDVNDILLEHRATPLPGHTMFYVALQSKDSRFQRVDKKKFRYFCNIAMRSLSGPSY